MSEPDPVVAAKLRHMASCLETYAVKMEEQEFEEAFEAADEIGSDDGEGCEICEALSSSLAGSVAFAMWFPDETVKEKVASMSAGVARSYAEDLADEIPTPPPGGDAKV
jgi:hypothetical protein